MSALPPALDHYDTRDGARPQRMLFLLGGLPVLAIVIFLIGLALGVSGEDVALMAVALVTALVASLPVVIDQGKPAADRLVMLALLSLCYVAWYVVPVFTYYIPAPGPIDAPGMGLSLLAPGDILVGQGVALAGLVGLLVGHAALGARWISGLLPRATREWPPQVVLAVAMLMLLLGWGILALSIVVPVTALGSGIISTLASSLIYANALLTYSWVRHRSSFAFLVLCVTIPFTSSMGFFTGSKQSVLVAPMMAALTIILYRRRVHARWIVLGILALTLLYPAHVFFRDVILAGNTLTAAHALRDPMQALSRVGRFLSGQRADEYVAEGFESTGARLDGLGVTSVIVRDSGSRVPFQNGRTLGLFFVAFVPRVLWADKPNISIGQWITDEYGSGPHITSATAPFTIGDYYLNFGLPGVIGGMFLLGVLMRITHECLLRGRPTAAGMLGAVVILYQIAVRFEGNVAIQYAGMVTAVVPVLLTHLVIRVFLPAPRPEPAGAEAPAFTAGAKLGA